MFVAARVRVGPSELRLIPKTDPDGAGRLNHLTVRRYDLDAMHRVRDRDAENLIVLVADHLTEFAFGDQLDGLYAEAGSQDAIEGGRGTAALQMAQHTS